MSKKSRGRLTQEEKFQASEGPEAPFNYETSSVELEHQTWYHLPLEEDKNERRKHLSRLRQFVNGYYSLNVKVTSTGRLGLHSF